MAKFTTLVEFWQFSKEGTEVAEDILADVMTDCVMELDLSVNQIKQIMGQFHNGKSLLANFFAHEKGATAFKAFIKNWMEERLETDDKGCES